MPPRAKSQGESKQGLIITLVFFILATIGLGVATYYGFAEQDKLTKAAKEAKKSEDERKDERNAYKFQTKMYLSYMGQAQGMEGVGDLGTEKSQFDSGSMKGVKDKEFVTKVLKTLEAKLGWNGNQPKDTLDGMIAKANTERDNLKNRVQKLETELAAAKKKVAATEAELAAAAEDYKKQLMDLKTNLKNDFVKSDKDLKDFRAEVDALSAARKKDKEDAEKEKIALAKQIDKLKSDALHLKGRIKDQEGQILNYEVKNAQAPASMRTDWKIIRMDARGLNPYINLGSADHVKPQLTFTIHAMG
ncbi:MAG: hypothetical protein ACRELG_25120, partial [Gemmataceae bacterium]